MMYVWTFCGRTVVVAGNIIKWACLLGLFIIFIVVIIIVANSPTSVKRILDTTKLPPIPIAELNENLDFILDHVELANLDCVFGITMAEGQLNLALETLNENNIMRGPLQSNLDDLLQKCSKIRELSVPQMKFSSNDVAKIGETLLDPLIWQKRSMEFKGFVDSLHLNRTETEFQQFILNGHPNEKESDSCIGTFLDGYDPKSRTRSSACKVDEACFDMMNNTEENWGYATTHRLLYFMVGTRVGCSSALAEIQADVTEIETRLCSSIYSEMLNYFDVGVPAIAKDLFIEQIILCGIEGFSDFLQLRFLELFLSWQNEHGCFGLYAEPLEARNLTGHTRVRRESLLMPYGCDSHMTGLGATIMAVYIRSLIDGFLKEF